MIRLSSLCRHCDRAAGDASPAIANVDTKENSNRKRSKMSPTWNRCPGLLTACFQCRRRSPRELLPMITPPVTVIILYSSHAQNMGNSIQYCNISYSTVLCMTYNVWLSKEKYSLALAKAKYKSYQSSRRCCRCPCRRRPLRDSSAAGQPCR